jgi:UDP-N-acetylglucosamine enolpyruvyl transferase
VNDIGIVQGRSYEGIVEKLTSIGASIKRVEVDEPVTKKQKRA